MRAFKLPKSTEAEQAARDRAIEAASKQASAVPMDTAELAAEVTREVASLVGCTIPQAASDLSVASIWPKPRGAGESRTSGRIFPAFEMKPGVATLRRE